MAWNFFKRNETTTEATDPNEIKHEKHELDINEVYSLAEGYKPIQQDDYIRLSEGDSTCYKILNIDYKNKTITIDNNTELNFSDVAEVRLNDDLDGNEVWTDFSEYIENKVTEKFDRELSYDTFANYLENKKNEIESKTGLPTEKINRMYFRSAACSRILGGISTVIGLTAMNLAKTNPPIYYVAILMRSIISGFAGSMTGKSMHLSNQGKEIEKLLGGVTKDSVVNLEALSTEEQIELLTRMTGYASLKAQRIDETIDIQQEIATKESKLSNNLIEKIRDKFSRNKSFKTAASVILPVASYGLSLAGFLGVGMAVGLNIGYAYLSGKDKTENTIDTYKHSKYVKQLTDILSEKEKIAKIESIKNGDDPGTLFYNLNQQEDKVERSKKKYSGYGAAFGAIISALGPIYKLIKGFDHIDTDHVAAVQHSAKAISKIGHGQIENISAPKSDALPTIDGSDLNPGHGAFRIDGGIDLTGKEHHALTGNPLFDNATHHADIAQGQHHEIISDLHTDTGYSDAGKASDSDLKEIFENPGKHLPKNVVDSLDERIKNGEVKDLKLVVNKYHPDQIQIKYLETNPDGKLVLKGINLDHAEKFAGHPSLNHVEEIASHADKTHDIADHATNHGVHSGGLHKHMSTHGDNTSGHLDTNHDSVASTANVEPQNRVGQFDIGYDKAIKSYDSGMNLNKTQLKSLLEEYNGKGEFVQRDRAKWLLDQYSQGKIKEIHLVQEPSSAGQPPHFQLKFLEYRDGKVTMSGLEINHKVSLDEVKLGVEVNEPPASNSLTDFEKHFEKDALNKDHLNSTTLVNTNTQPVETPNPADTIQPAHHTDSVQPVNPVQPEQPVVPDGQPIGHVKPGIAEVGNSADSSDVKPGISNAGTSSESVNTPDQHVVPEGSTEAILNKPELVKPVEPVQPVLPVKP